MRVRPRVQIHLSTAVVLMIVAAILVLMNLKLAGRWFGHGKLYSETGYDFGFPIPWLSWGEGKSYSDESWDVVVKTHSIFEISWGMAALNAGISLLLLYIVAFICERRILRQKAANDK